MLQSPGGSNPVYLSEGRALTYRVLITRLTAPNVLNRLTNYGIIRALSAQRESALAVWKLEADRLAVVGKIQSKAPDLFFGLIRVDKATRFSYTPPVALSSCMCVIREVFQSPEQRTTDWGKKERPKWGASPAKP
jgi:hypothetical protein